MKHSTTLSLVLFAALAPISAAAMPVSIPACRRPDASFHEFLRRFENEASFRRSRLELPLVVRAGDGVAVASSIELWTLPRILAQKAPFIYSPAERTKHALAEDILLLQPKRYAEVFQSNAGDADDTKLLFQFRKVTGCWILEGFDDLGE